MERVLLKVDDISKSFTPYFFLKKASVNVFQGISFEVTVGECLGIIGPNGIGKTTLIKIIAGLIEQTGGEISFVSALKKGDTSSKNKRIGMAGSEERSFFWRLSAYDNLDFFGSLYGISKRDRRDVIESMLDFFGLLEFKNKRFMLFSSGMKQKLILIRAIMHKPELLLLDEPLKNLDAVSRAKFLEWLDTSIQQKQLSAIFVSHELEDLLKVSSRIALMERECFTIFPASYVKEIVDSSRQVRIKIGRLHDPGIIPFDELAVEHENDFSSLFLRRPDEDNRLKKLLDMLWTNKIELISLEMLPPNIEIIMQKLRKQETRDKRDKR